MMHCSKWRGQESEIKLIEGGGSVLPFLFPFFFFSFTFQHIVLVWFESFEGFVGL